MLLRVLVGVLVVGSFGIFAQAIVAAKTLQLRIEVSRRQLLNYRLSSEILRSKLRLLFQMEADFSGEIRMTVLESSVLNADLSALPVKVSTLGQGGIAATNVVRVMNLKAPLHLEADRRALLLLQYAFYLERKKRYQEAVARYRQVLPLLSEPNDHGFALLHLAYCQTLLGQGDRALANLDVVIRTHRGQHFGDAAIELANVVRENNAREREVARLYPTAAGRATAYYATGQYHRVLQELTQRPQLSAREIFMKGRSLEETGNVAGAVVEYRRASAVASEAVRRQAVRRLLLLGEFLSAEPEVKEFARREAGRLGETQVLSEIREARAFVRAPVLLAALGQTPAKNEVPGGEAALVSELRTLFPDEGFVQALPAVITQSDGKAAFVDPAATRLRVRAASADQKSPEGGERSAPTGRSEGGLSVAAKTSPATEGAPLRARSAGPVASPPQRERKAEERSAATPSRPRASEGAKKEEPLSARIRQAARIEIRFVDGRRLLAEQLELAGGMLRIRLAESTVVLPLSIVAEVHIWGQVGRTRLAVRFPGRPEELVNGLRRDRAGGFVLLAPDGGEVQRVGTPDEISIR